VRHTFDCVGLTNSCDTRFHIDAGRREDGIAQALLGPEGRARFPWQPGFLNHLAHERVTIGVYPERGKPKDDDTLLDVIAWQYGVAFDRSNSKTREIIVLALVDTGHFGSFAADQSAAGFAAADADACNYRGPDFRFEFPAGIVVEEEKGLGTLHHQIVDTH